MVNMTGLPTLMTFLHKRYWQPVAWFALGLLATAGAGQADEFADLDRQLEMSSDDRPVQDEILYPDWFKFSFLDLQDDVSEARQEGKQGIAVYFGQRHCAYCKALMEINLQTPDIVNYMRKNFDVIALDIWGGRTVTDINGNTLSEREYSIRENTNFTPSFIFYDADGRQALRLRGYYPPYTFRAALKYVAEGYYKEESLRTYLDRADPTAKFDLEDLNWQPFFARPPYALDRSHVPAQRPLVVFFEQRNCHACDILHSGPLSNRETAELLRQFDVVQLDVNADTAVLTPGGERRTASQWADELGLFYSPALVFFDESGKEIIRLDSVTRLYRLKGVLNYVLNKAYQQYPTFLEYRHGRDSRDRNF
jgi:thioredoxin-related protein